ncbi:MAG: 2-isopropylmalate synthase [Proteobacteria bacterium]|nr:2-isopropylmalate synthase [Pseudomonadota bacterium]
MDDQDYVRIFDTTLRDGEQSPGATMTSSEKIEVARVLSRLGVDVIEAGFPAASLDDLAAVQAIAAEVGQRAVEGRPSDQPPIVCGLARATQRDIDKAWSGVQGARRPRIHTFLATSPIHREHKLRMSREQVKQRVREMVAYARSLCADVEFSPEDGGRTEPEFLHEVLAIAIAAGATTLNIPDTVGYTLPDEYGALIAGVRSQVAGVEGVVLSVHCHDDLGLASANTLAGLRAGARQAEVTLNGIGERAGNAGLEEIVMALHTRRATLGLRTQIDTTQLVRASRVVSACTGIAVQPNKAIVGANAFAHESGIHQDGMLKHHQTYEIMRPETVGAGQTLLVLGKHSGRHAFSLRLIELGYHLEGEQLDKAFERFKQLADRKKQVADADLEALISSEFLEARDYYTLEALQVSCGSIGMPTATVRLRGPDGTQHVRAVVGTGPVDAAYKAIDQIVELSTTLLEFSVRSVTEGIDALGEVGVRIRAEVPGPRISPQHAATTARVFRGHGAETDIVVASAKAYLTAINRLIGALERSRDAVARTPTGELTPSTLAPNPSA